MFGAQVFTSKTRLTAVKSENQLLCR